jgi:hypothetical protein
MPGDAHTFEGESPTIKAPDDRVASAIFGY